MSRLVESKDNPERKRRSALQEEGWYLIVVAEMYGGDGEHRRQSVHDAEAGIETECKSCAANLPWRRLDHAPFPHPGTRRAAR
jgi:hypothetical protein